MPVLSGLYLPELWIWKVSEQMKDVFGRTIDYLRISITDRCNLRCRYCMPENLSLVSMREILTYEEIEQICRAAAELGIQKIKITGGEPLVRRDCPQLIGKLKRIPGITQVTLTTNGILLEKALPELIAQGLDAVNISLDTLDSNQYEKMTGKRELQTVWKSLRRAADSSLRVKINVVLQKGWNEKEWLQLAEISRRYPVDVRFIELMPIGAGKEAEGISQEELLQNLHAQFPQIRKDTRIHGNGPAVYYRIPGFQGSIGLISAIHGKFCQSCNRLRLTSQGKLKPCLCFAESVDLRKILRGEEESRAAGMKPREEIETDGQKEIRENLRQAILIAVRQKPPGHEFGIREQVTERLPMVQIGG